MLLHPLFARQDHIVKELEQQQLLVSVLLDIIVQQLDLHRAIHQVTCAHEVLIVQLEQLLLPPVLPVHTDLF